MRTQMTMALAALLALGIALPAPAQVVERPVPGDPVVLDSGKLAGKVLASGVRAYLGVPFAAPPVRDLRWRDPQPVTAWQGIYNADRPAPECIQPLRGHSINHYFGEEATSEDCLYLNVWAPPGPAPTGMPYPVVVWIYGGAYAVGSANIPLYGGEAMAAKGVVYVGISYRVGALGFLAHPDLTAESPHHSSGNYGLLDQVAALRWVKRNIGAFGGDPANVTIMGQSAGSMSVALLQVDPLAKGLFQRAVGLSGAPFGEMMPPRPLATAEHSGETFQTTLKASSLAALRDLPADRFLASDLPRPSPVLDGYVVPAPLEKVFAEHRQNDVPILIGFTADEGFRSLGKVNSVADYRAAVHANFGDQADKVLAAYPVRTDTEAARAAIDIARDSTVGAQMNGWARAQAKEGKAPVFAYFFTRVHPYAEGIHFSDHDPASVGAYHTGDVPYWLDTLDALNRIRHTRDWTEDDRALANHMSGAILAFAANGNPNGGGLPAWPSFDMKRQEVMELGLNAHAEPWPDHQRLAVFDAQNPPSLPSLRTGGRD